MHQDKLKTPPTSEEYKRNYDKIVWLSDDIKDKYYLTNTGKVYIANEDKPIKVVNIEDNTE
jgi:hypothetical protein